MSKAHKGSTSKDRERERLREREREDTESQTHVYTLQEKEKKRKKEKKTERKKRDWIRESQTHVWYTHVKSYLSGCESSTSSLTMVPYLAEF